MRKFFDQVDEEVPTEVVGQRPSSRLVDPHERRMHDEALIHPEVQRDLQCFQRVIAAVGIAGVVGLAHAADQVFQSPPVAHGCRKCEEQQIASRYEGVRKAACGEIDSAVLCQSCLADATEHCEVEHVIGAQSCRPVGKLLAERVDHAEPALEFDTVALAVIEADRFDMLEPIKCPSQTDSGVLPTREEDESGFRHAICSVERVRIELRRARSVVGLDLRPALVILVHAHAFTVGDAREEPGCDDLSGGVL